MKVFTFAMWVLLTTLESIGHRVDTPTFWLAPQPDAQQYRLYELNQGHADIKMMALHEALIKLGHLPPNTDPNKVVVVTTLPDEWEVIVLVEE